MNGLPRQPTRVERQACIRMLIRPGVAPLIVSPHHAPRPSHHVNGRGPRRVQAVATDQGNSEQHDGHEPATDAAGRFRPVSVAQWKHSSRVVRASTLLFGDWHTCGIQERFTDRLGGGPIQKAEGNSRESGRK